MKSQLMQRLLTFGGIAVLALVLAGCASNTSKQTQDTASYPGGPGDRIEGENPYANQDTPRCPAGYSLQCEAKKVGRIRFSGYNKDDLDSCGCVPYEGAPMQQAIPGLDPAQ